MAKKFLDSSGEELQLVLGPRKKGNRNCSGVYIVKNRTFNRVLSEIDVPPPPLSYGTFR